MSDSDVSEWQLEKHGADDYDSEDEEVIGDGSPSQPARIPAAASQPPGGTKRPAPPPPQPPAKAHKKASAPSKKAGSGGVPPGGGPPPIPSHSLPTPAALSPETGGTLRPIGDVCDFRIVHESNLEQQVPMDRLSLGQRHAVLYAKLHPSEKDRCILGYVLDWAISVGPHEPNVWAITEDGWYRLTWPAKSYGDAFKSVHRKLDLFTRCVRIVATASSEADIPTDSHAAAQALLQGDGDPSSPNGKHYSPDEVVEHCGFVISQLRAAGAGNGLPANSSGAERLAQALETWWNGSAKARFAAAQHQQLQQQPLYTKAPKHGGNKKSLAAAQAAEQHRQMQQQQQMGQVPIEPSPPKPYEALEPRPSGSKQEQTNQQPITPQMQQGGHGALNHDSTRHEMGSNGIDSAGPASRGGRGQRQLDSKQENATGTEEEVDDNGVPIHSGGAAAAIGDESVSAEDESDLEPKSEPPALIKLDGLDDEEIGGMLQIWDFFQVFGAHFEVPPFGFAQLQEALSYDFDDSDPADERTKSYAFLLTVLHCTLLQSLGRSAFGYRQLCEGFKNNYDTAKALSWPEVMWTVFVPLAKNDQTAAALVHEADATEYWRMSRPYKTKALLLLINNVSSSESFQRYCNSVSDRAVASYRNGQIMLVPPEDMPMALDEDGSSKELSKEESDRLRSNSIAWIRYAGDRQLLRRGVPAARDGLGRRYWEVGASCAENKLWVEDTEGKMLGYYDKEGCKKLVSWCDENRRRERTLRKLSNFIASTSYPAVPFKEPEGMYSSQSSAHPTDVSFLRSLFMRLVDERIVVPYWGQDRQWLAKHSRLLHMLQKELKAESSCDMYREALGLLEDLLSAGGLSRKWQMREIRERWREKLRACSTAARELFLLQKISDHQQKEEDSINRQEYVRKCSLIGVDPRCFYVGEEVVLVRSGVRELYQHDLGPGWPLPPPLRPIERCRVLRAVYRTTEGAREAKPLHTCCWLLLERVVAHRSKAGAGSEAERERESQEGIAYAWRPITAEAAEQLECYRVDANLNMLSKWEAEQPDISTERILSMPLPVGGQASEYVIPRDAFDQFVDNQWKVGDRVQALLSNTIMLLSPWNRRVRKEVSQSNLLQAIPSPGTVIEVTEREDMWHSVLVDLDNGFGPMYFSPWDLEQGPPAPLAKPGQQQQQQQQQQQPQQAAQHDGSNGASVVVEKQQQQSNRSAKSTTKLSMKRHNGTMKEEPYRQQQHHAGANGRQGPEQQQEQAEGDGKLQRQVARNLGSTTQKFWKLVIDQTQGKKPRVFTYQGTPIELLKLFSEVCSRGGYEVVTKQGQWVQVARMLESSPRVDRPACEHIQSVYHTYLHQVELSLVQYWASQQQS